MISMKKSNKITFELIEKALLIEEKPVSFEILCNRIASLLKKDKLSEVQKREVYNILNTQIYNGNIFCDELETLNSEQDGMDAEETFTLMRKTKYRMGLFYGCRNGEGFVAASTSHLDNDGNVVVKFKDYKVPKSNTNNAIDGDLVLIDISQTPKVIDIVDREIEYIAGTVRFQDDSYYLETADKRKRNITICLNGDVTEDQRVVVSLGEKLDTNMYIGDVVYTFGDVDNPKEDTLWALYCEGGSAEYSRAALKQAEETMAMPDYAILEREDFRDSEAFTIDGDGTFDMDDSIEISINERGNYIVRVHIIDMASLVPLGTPLDICGFKKGETYYCGNVNFTEYPKNIAYDVASLHQGVSRLCLSDVIELTPDGEVVDFKCVPSIIKSKLKMSYKEVDRVLDGKDFDERYLPFCETLKKLLSIADMNYKKRIEGGAVEYDCPDIEGVYDADGHMTGVEARSNSPAERIVKELMLLANIEKTKFRIKYNIPCVFRNEDSPKESDINRFLTMLSSFGIHCEYTGAELLHDSHKFQQLINIIQENGGYATPVLLRELIKSTPRAYYSHLCSGHRALATQYSQGTSAQRRYGDKFNQHGDLAFLQGENLRHLHELAPRVAYHLRVMSRRAEEVWKRTFRQQSIDYMSNFIGEKFSATIIGLSSKGISIQLDNGIQGFVPIKNLPNGYHYNGKYLVGSDNNPNYYFGDWLNVLLVSSEKSDHRVIFTILSVKKSMGNNKENRYCYEKKHS